MASLSFFKTVKFNTLKSNQVTYYLLCLGYLVFCSVIYNKGLDLTDSGYHLANQMSAKKLGLDYIFFMPIFWFTDVLAANFFDLFDGITLVLIRAIVLALGFVQILVLIKIQGNSDLKLAYAGSILLFLIGLYIAIPLGFVLISADYYSIPTFFCYIFIYLLVLFFKNPSALTTAILSLLCFAMLNLRITTGLIILAMPLFIDLLNKFFKREPITLRKEMVWFYILTCIFVITEAFYYTSIKNLNISNLMASRDWHNQETHPGILVLIKGYLSEFFHALLTFRYMLLGLIAYFLYCLREVMVNKTCILKGYKVAYIESLYKNLSLLSYCLSVIWLIMIVMIPLDTLITLPHLVAITYLFYLFILMFIGKKSFENHAPLIFAAGIVPIAIFIGTNTGLSKIGYGLPILIFVINLMVSSLPKISAAMSVRFVFYFFYITFLSLIIFKGGTRYYENIKLSQITELTYKMQNGRVAGIFTRPNSGKAIDELLVEIKKRTTKEDKIFTFLAIPLIHYASDRNNIIDNLPNFDITQPNNVLQNKLKPLCLTPILTPKIIVESKRVVFDPNWEKHNQAIDRIPESNFWNINKNSILIDTIVKENCKPKLAWENSYFAILEPTI